MTKQRTEVRKFCNGISWVVDILATHTASDGYVRPDGTAGGCYWYKNKESAETAETLYLGKNTCGNCSFFDSALPSGCKEAGYGTRAQNTSCDRFELKASAGEKILAKDGIGGILARETKETNPKDVIGMKKAPISTLSCAVLYEMGLGMFEGARKYGRHNYRAMGVSATVYYDAAIGHLMDWWEGEDIDPDSGLNHVTKAMTALATLRDSMLMGNWVDDRPLRNPNKLYKKSFNPKAEAIIEKYPDAVEPYTEMNKDLDRTKSVSGGY